MEPVTKAFISFLASSNEPTSNEQRIETGRLATYTLLHVRSFSLMFTRPRQRRGPYAMASASPLPSIIRSVILVAIIAVALYFIGSWILWLFGQGNATQRTSALLLVEGRGPVNVSLEGGAIQRAEDTMKVYGGDRISTGSNGHAALMLFDGTRMRFDQQTDALLVDSARGTESSAIDIELSRGRAVVTTPTLQEFSGSVLRQVQTPAFTLSIPSGSLLLIGESTLAVFEADSLGVHVQVQGASEPIVIGEGQQFVLPANANRDGDLYVYRSALKDEILSDTFIGESRSAINRAVTFGSTTSRASEDLLKVTAPQNDAILASSTVTVEGVVGRTVARVRVNGYPAPIDQLQRTFSQELALKDGEPTEIRIEALDDKGLVLQEIRRTVKRTALEVETPHIVSPGKDGETYRTQRQEFEIRGTASADAAGIIVNEYRLQLYRQGSKVWSYLARTELKNLVPGKNVFSVVAIDAAGNRSNPVTLTILLEEGPEGVIAGSAGSVGATASVVDPAALPNNPPLKPGSLRVTGPTAGTQHTATGSEILIEGTTSPDTASMWVNEYRLQLYKAGKTTWNYIAKEEFKNMKKGKNVYKITARDRRDQIIDVLEYIVNY